MNRINFYTIETVDGVPELDFLHNSLSEFVPQYPLVYYRVNGTDLMRPWLISNRFYGTVDFWWIIMLLNNVDNPLVDLTVGQVLKIPSKLDIYAFQKKYRIRRST
ncbi:MAG: baseplate wedge protein 53 [Firmicutes bacterium]|nr:baseplate wedge protein 53 [Bacillota bacterium]